MTSELVSQGLSPNRTDPGPMTRVGASCERQTSNPNQTNLVKPFPAESIRPHPNPYSLLAYLQLPPEHINRKYRAILGRLKEGPKSREQIEEELHLSGNYVRPRIVELMEMGVVQVCGEGRTTRGRRCEKLSIVRGVA